MGRVINRAAVHSYLRYAASEPLRESPAGFTVSAWPRLASLVAERRSVQFSLVRVGRPKMICRPGPSPTDWPERVPVTSVEVGVFEAWFGDVFDELLGPYQ